MRTNPLELHLEQNGFRELFGIALWGKDVNGTAVDTNSGVAKVFPHINAAYDNYVGYAETVEELDALIEKSETTGFFVGERKRLSDHN